MRLFQKILSGLLIVCICLLTFPIVHAEEFAPPSRYEELLKYFPENFLVRKPSTPLTEIQIASMLDTIRKLPSKNAPELEFTGVPASKPMLAFCLDTDKAKLDQYYFLPEIKVKRTYPPKTDSYETTYTGLLNLQENIWIISDHWLLDKIAISNGYTFDPDFKTLPSFDICGKKGYDLYLLHDKGLQDGKQSIGIRKDFYLMVALMVWQENFIDLQIPKQYERHPFNPPMLKTFDELNDYMAAHYKIKKMSGYTFSGDDKENLKISYEMEINYYNDVTRVQLNEHMKEIGEDDYIYEPFVPDWKSLTIKNIGDIYEITSDKNERYMFFRNIDLKVYSAGKKGSFRTNLHRIRFKKGKWVGINAFLSFSDKKTIVGIPFRNVQDAMNSYNIYYSYAVQNKISENPMPEPEFLAFIRSLIIKYPFADTIYT